MNHAFAARYSRSHRTRALACAVLLGGGGLTACATTTATDMAQTAASSRADATSADAPRTLYPDADIPDAAPLAEDPSTTPIVIAATQDGIGTSWTSITENQLVRTAAELSNLGGAPFVLGAVGAMVAVDAEPKGRARRTAEAVSGVMAPDALDGDMATQLSSALEARSDDGTAPTVEVRTIDSMRDLPDNAWIVQTQYVLAEDATAMRITARVGHSDDFRAAAEAQAARRGLERMERNAYSYAYENEQRRRFARRMQKKREPRYNGAFVFHSDPIELPAAGGFPNPAAREAMTAQLRDALDAEHAARVAAAENRFERDLQTATSDRKRRKAESRRDKAVAKAGELRASSLRKVEDDELDAMERLVLGVEAWQSDADSEGTALSEAVQSAHVFLAEAVARGLAGEAFESKLEESYRQQLMENLQGVRLLDADQDGRITMQVVDGDTAGVVVSLPAEGAADYGGSVATP